jgi:hypothetical protein
MCIKRTGFYIDTFLEKYFSLIFFNLWNWVVDLLSAFRSQSKDIYTVVLIFEPHRIRID